MSSDKRQDWHRAPEDIEAEETYARGRLPERTYIYGRFKDDPTKRYAIKVWDGRDIPAFEWQEKRRDFIPDGQTDSCTVKQEAVIRVMPHARTRYQVKATLIESSRHVERVVIQQFTEGSDKPHSIPVITLAQDDLVRLLKFFRNIRYVRLDSDGNKERFDDAVLDDLVADDLGRARFVKDHPELVERLRQDASSLERVKALLQAGEVGEVVDLLRMSQLSGEVVKRIVEAGLTSVDVLAVAHRREQLQIFERLLNDEVAFKHYKSEWGCVRDEDVWQRLLEDNPWILGYGLRYQFGVPVGRKLEQVVRGASIASFGKRADGLLRTLGAINSLCFVELKPASKALLAKEAYRSGAYCPSPDLIGAVVQSQQTVQAALHEFGDRLRHEDPEGYEDGHAIFNLAPKALIIMGSLREFIRDDRVNTAKFRSFELFRRSMTTPEILTFDELYERARHIVEGGPTSASAPVVPPPEAQPIWDEDDIPF